MFDPFAKHQVWYTYIILTMLNLSTALQLVYIGGVNVSSGVDLLGPNHLSLYWASFTQQNFGGPVFLQTPCHDVQVINISCTCHAQRRPKG